MKGLLGMNPGEAFSVRRYCHGDKAKIAEAAICPAAFAGIEQLADGAYIALREANVIGFPSARGHGDRLRD